ncbi:unnamed protein product [Periconia digitata]|uniref:Uncharacterized protein n=1 Tax=Periconia digitata TaxID=1303443 RepID=A0A9W4UTB8_9PLEO|nr:unnamed protein product [Periconia digitata]
MTVRRDHRARLPPPTPDLALAALGPALVARCSYSPNSLIPTARTLMYHVLYPPGSTCIDLCSHVSMSASIHITSCVNFLLNQSDINHRFHPTAASGCCLGHDCIPPLYASWEPGNKEKKKESQSSVHTLPYYSLNPPSLYRSSQRGLRRGTCQLARDYSLVHSSFTGNPICLLTHPPTIYLTLLAYIGR